jgi:hypothetical protein
MKTLKEYIAESSEWMMSPAAGDTFAFELPDEVICETYIIEVADDCILLDSTPEINAALAEWATLEDTDEGDSNIVMETMGYGSLVGEEETDEAKYQGREVTLNKPMAGDVKKSKVYVKDPKTGNVKKVNFGHGGKTARRLGQKTMKIKKSNPARRKSFRARHHCDNPGPKTKARYWSCRAW